MCQVCIISGTLHFQNYLDAFCGLSYGNWCFVTGMMGSDYCYFSSVLGAVELIKQVCVYTPKTTTVKLKKGKCSDI